MSSTQTFTAADHSTFRVVNQAQPKTGLSAAVIGSGFGGLASAIRLQAMGIHWFPSKI